MFSMFALAPEWSECDFVITFSLFFFVRTRNTISNTVLPATWIKKKIQSIVSLFGFVCFCWWLFLHPHSCAFYNTARTHGRDETTLRLWCSVLAASLPPSLRLHRQPSGILKSGPEDELCTLLRSKSWHDPFNMFHVSESLQLAKSWTITKLMKITTSPPKNHKKNGMRGTQAKWRP